MTDPTWVDVAREFVSAKEGDRIIYYEGFLMADLQQKHKIADVRRIKAIAEFAWTQYDTGNATLVQRRLGPLMYQYMLVKKRAPKGAQPSDKFIVGKREPVLPVGAVVLAGRKRSGARPVQDRVQSDPQAVGPL